MTVTQPQSSMLAVAKSQGWNEELPNLNFMVDGDARGESVEPKTEKQPESSAMQEVRRNLRDVLDDYKDQPNLRFHAFYAIRDQWTADKRKRTEEDKDSSADVESQLATIYFEETRHILDVPEMVPFPERIRLLRDIFECLHSDGHELQGLATQLRNLDLEDKMVKPFARNINEELQEIAKTLKPSKDTPDMEAW